MNPRNDLYTIPTDRLAEIRAERLAEMQQASRLAPRLQEKGQSRSPFADPALYLTVWMAAMVVALLDMAVRMQ